MRNDVERQIRSVVEDAARSDDPAAKQVADLWASWMDEDAIERRAAAPLKPYLDKVKAIRTRDDLLRLFTEPGYTSLLDIEIR